MKIKSTFKEYHNEILNETKDGFIQVFRFTDGNV
jgi:hypothetical protein